MWLWAAVEAVVSVNTSLVGLKWTEYYVLTLIVQMDLLHLRCVLQLLIPQLYHVCIFYVIFLLWHR